MRIVKRKEEEDDEMPQRFWLFGPSFVQPPKEVKREEEQDVSVEPFSDNPPSLLESKKRARSVSKKISSSKKARVETPKNGSSSKKLIKNRSKKSKIEKKAKVEVMEDGNAQKGVLVDVKIENTETAEHRMGGRRRAASSIVNMESDAIVKVENGESVKGGSGKRGTGSTNRWTEERYTRAEKVVVGLMKENGGPPLVRRELRDMARKQIGDTGLLDHLLKHMAGKVVGDGGERFMRGYNEDGVMFYWLESAGTEDGRAGRGFCRCSDGCVEEIKGLKDGIATLNREMEELRSSKESEEIAWKERYERLLETNIQLEVQMAKVKNSVQGLKDKYEKLLEKNVKLEAEMEGMSSSYQGLKGEMLPKEEKKDGDEIAEEMEMVEDDKRESDSEGGDEKHDNMLEHFKDFGSHLKLTCRGLLKY